MTKNFVAARVLATYLIPGCVGRGVRLGSENSSAAGAAGAGGVWKSGGHFSGKKKAPAATYPQVQGFQKSGGHFSGEKKGACGNVVSRSGLPKNPKIENSQNQNPFCPKCRQYFFKPEKKPPGPIWGHPGPFFAWAGKSKNFAYFPWWALAAIHPRLSLIHI